MDKVGNLVRLREKPDGLEDFSLLEWFLITAAIEGTPRRFQVKRIGGLQFFVEEPNLGKEYDFRTFELSKAEELAEHLILLNLKMDIQQATQPVSGRQATVPYPYAPSGYPSTGYTVPVTYTTTIPPPYSVTYGPTTGITGTSSALSNAQSQAQASAEQQSMWNQLFGGK